MADKQVAVRLVVQGGDKAKADFRSVGAAGDQAMRQLGQTAKTGGGALRSTTADMSAAAKGSRDLGFQMQNAGYQVGDFFVQVAGGQGVMRAAAQQLPQLLGSFGMWGAIAGAAVAAGAAIVPMLFETDGGAKEAEAAMGGLTAATKAYQQAAEELQRPMGDMREQFGANAQAAREVQKILFNLARVRISDAQAAIGEGIDDQLSGLREMVAEYQQIQQTEANTPGMEYAAAEAQLAIIADIRDEWGMTFDEASRVAASIDAYNAALKEGDEQAKAIAMQELSAALADGLDNGIGLSEEMKVLVEQVAQASMEQMEFAARTADAEAAAQGVASVDIAGNIGAGADEAGRLAGNLAAASAEARFLAAQRALATAGEVSSGRGGDPRTSSQQGYGEFGRQTLDDIIASETRKIAKASGGGRRGGSGGGRDKADGFGNAMDRTEDQIGRLKAEAAAYAEAAAAGTDYGDAVEFAKKKAELLAAAQKQGIAITPQLTAQIEKQAQAYVTAAQSAEQARQSAEELARSSERGRDALENVFGAVVDGSDAAKQAVANLLLEIARVQASKGLMGLLEGFGGGGIIEALGGLLSGARAGGGGVKAGGAYLVNEATPRSEIFVPSQNGAILNVAQAQAALRAQAVPAGSATPALVQVSLSPELVGQILQQAGAQSVRLVQAADQRLPERMAQINRNPRVR